jgi:pyroglutamyl-peptidase
MKILVTAFEAFGGESINPSQLIIQNLPKALNDNNIITLILPTVFDKSVNILSQAINDLGPEVVVCLGQAGGRFDISVERIAININDCSIADNEGNIPIDTPIDPQGPSAYFSTLPIKAMVQKIRHGGIPSSISNTAGTFVCNHLMYGALNYIHNNTLNIKCGFIHIPFLPIQVVDKRNQPSMDLASMIKGITLALEACIENSQDIKKGEGAIC